MDHWTQKVTARRQLAEAISGEHRERALAAGMKMKDLELLIQSGKDAEEADKEQARQLARMEADFAGRGEAGDELFEREARLRDRLPAVVGDLREEGNRRAATFLEQLSFARFRYAEVPASRRSTTTPTTSGTTGATGPTGDGVATPEETAAIARVQRVAREDRPGRAIGLASLCDVLAGEAAIMTHLAERSVSADWLARLGTDARAFGNAGRNVRLAAEATQREAVAVRQQREKWQQVRRLVRATVKGVPALEKKYAEC